MAKIFTTMNKKLTISVNEQTYQALKAKIGERKVGRFIESLVRPFVIKTALDQMYAEMAKDKQREQDAAEWANNTLEDFGTDET